MALSEFIKHRYKLQRWGNVASKCPLKGLYEAPLIKASRPLKELSFLVVDCEMTGLNAQKHELLSIGWVKIDRLGIDYSSRRHVLLHAKQSVGESYVIHGLDDRKIAGAGNAGRAISMLAKDMEGAVLVFHHAVLDLAFLQKTSLHDFACPLLFQYVDTMDIERRLLEKQGRTGALQLNLCRNRYHLPPAMEHNAMFDAVATAELFLAQCAALGAGQKKRGATLSSLSPRLV